MICFEFIGPQKRFKSGNRFNRDKWSRSAWFPQQRYSVIAVPLVKPAFLFGSEKPPATDFPGGF
jgi:hypothetical protein